MASSNASSSCKDESESSEPSSSENVTSSSSPSLHKYYKRLSKNFTKGERFKSDMHDDLFDLECGMHLKSLQLSPSEISLLQMATTGQGANRRWKTERHHRLTASNFGRVLHLHDASYRGFLVKKLLHLIPKTSSNDEKAMDYGRFSERRAVFAYQNFRDQIITPCGLFVHSEFGYLAASPDGLIDDDGILEVKCPYFARYMPPLIIPKYSQHFYCSMSPEGSSLILDKQHDYYYQIQGQLEITDREWCDFVVWTPHGMHVERIYRDESVWDEMLPKLEDFYKLSLLPEIVNSRHARGLPIREPDFVLEATRAGL